MHYEFDGTTTWNGFVGVTPTFLHAPLTMNQWNTFEITQLFSGGKYILSVTCNDITYAEVNGVVQPEVENTNPFDYPSVDVFTSTAGAAPTEGEMRNLQLCTSATDQPWVDPGQGTGSGTGSGTASGKYKIILRNYFCIFIKNLHKTVEKELCNGTM